MKPRIPLPDDFAVRAKEMERRDLPAFYGVSRHTIDRWIVSTGVKPRKPPAHNRRPVPDDFHGLAQTMHKTGLLRHYQTSDSVLSRWLAETDIAPAAFIPVKRPSLGSLSSMGRAHMVKIGRVYNTSIYDEAADTLRRERFPVNRCNERGGYDPKGRFWRVGIVFPLTPDELLARAAKYQRKAA